jgi:ribokinase
VVGSFMMDLVVRAPRRPRSGETVIGTDFQRYLGGKGFNQAIAAARSGAATTMVGRLGDDEFGREFLQQLAIDGIDHRHVTVDPTLGTGVGAPVVEAGGENSIVVVPRANAACSASDIERSATTIAGSDVVLLQLELPIDAVVAACRIARAASTTVILNPAPAHGPHTELLGLVDVLVPNEGEAGVLLGESGEPDVDRLAARWGCQVVLTAAAAGCVVATGRATWTVPSVAVEPVDTVGAGDAFCGALAAWLAGGASIDDAVRYANAAGALAVTRFGAEPAMPHRHDVVALVDAAGLVKAPGA